MSLPGIMAPAGTPVFRNDGHSREDDSIYANVRPTTGHSRTRPLFTRADAVVNVELFLSAARLAAWDDWYEDALLAGARSFAAQVKNRGPGLLWYEVRWIDFSIEMLPGNRGKVLGKLLLIGDGTTTPPDTSSIAMEMRVPLVGVAGTVSSSSSLAMEMDVRLVQPALLGMEVLVALLGVAAPSGETIYSDTFSGGPEDISAHAPDLEPPGFGGYVNGGIASTTVQSGFAETPINGDATSFWTAQPLTTDAAFAPAGRTYVEFIPSLSDPGDGGMFIEFDWGPGASDFIVVTCSRVSGVEAISCTLNSVDLFGSVPVTWDGQTVRVEFQSGDQEVYVNGSSIGTGAESCSPVLGSDEPSIYAFEAPIGTTAGGQLMRFSLYEVGSA